MTNKHVLKSNIPVFIVLLIDIIYHLKSISLNVLKRILIMIYLFTLHRDYVLENKRQKHICIFFFVKRLSVRVC